MQLLRDEGAQPESDERDGKVGKISHASIGPSEDEYSAGRPAGDPKYSFGAPHRREDDSYGLLTA